MKILLASLFLLLVSAAHAQPAHKQLPFDATAAPDLVFPSEATALADANSPRMMLLKPEGSGPFPALVLGHQCAGLVFNRNNPKAANWSMLAWARESVGRGYVVLLIDFLDQRGGQSVCQMPQGGVTFGRATKDFLQAAEYLKSLPYVDRNRLAMAGFSQGALIAFFLNSRATREAFKLDGYRAYVSFYPLCGYARNGPGNYAGNIVQEDLDTPHLVLTGGKDNETPPADCQALLEPLKTKGRPVQLHHYPDATHCWDCKSLNGFSKDGRHGRVTYLYDEEATADSRQRMFDFLGTALRIPPQPR